MTKFKNYSDDELIKVFNKEVWNSWWTSARAEYLADIREEFNIRNFDYSEIWDKNGISYKNKIELVEEKGEKVVRVID